jgi:ferredoxin
MVSVQGIKDDSGEWFLIIDTDKCNGCGRCVDGCLGTALELGSVDDDPFSDKQVVKVKEEESKNLRYTCAPCKPGYGDRPAACIASCESGALSHTNAWRLVYAKYLDSD